MKTDQFYRPLILVSLIWLALLVVFITLHLGIGNLRIFDSGHSETTIEYGMQVQKIRNSSF
jgi:hypothetical protein